MTIWRPAPLVLAFASLGVLACQPPPQGRPIYTPVPESLQPQTVQPTVPTVQNEEVRVDVQIFDGDAVILEPKFETLTNSESTLDFEDEEGQVHSVTVRVNRANPKTRSHEVWVTYAVDDEVLISGTRSPLPGQRVAFDGPDALSLELVVVNRSVHR